MDYQLSDLDWIDGELDSEYWQEDYTNREMVKEVVFKAELFLTRIGKERV